MDVCLGNYERHFNNELGNSVCSVGAWKSICLGSLLIHSVLSSNIPESFLLYLCFEVIKKQTEKSKDVMGKKSFRIRKRDNGLVISISIIQWGIEVVNTILYYIYVIFLNGISNYADKFFSLYLITFTMIIQPSFYLYGDAEFRRSLVDHGFFVTIKNYLF